MSLRSTGGQTRQLLMPVAPTTFDSVVLRVAGVAHLFPSLAMGCLGFRARVESLGAGLRLVEDLFNPTPWRKLPVEL